MPDQPATTEQGENTSFWAKNKKIIITVTSIAVMILIGYWIYCVYDKNHPSTPSTTLQPGSTKPNVQKPPTTLNLSDIKKSGPTTSAPPANTATPPPDSNTSGAALISDMFENSNNYIKN